MVVEAAVLVVDEEEGSVGPLRARHEGVQHVGDELLADLDVRRWMLVVLDVLRVGEHRIDERHLREIAGGRIREELGGARQLRRLGADAREEERAVRRLAVVDLPRDGRHRRVHEVEDRRLHVLPARREVVADVAERGPSEQVEAVRERLRQHRGEVTIGHRERAVERVIEGQRGLVVEAHRPSARRIGRDRVSSREAVHRPVVPLVVGAVPRVVEIRDLAEPRLGEGGDRRTHRVRGVRVRGVRRLGLGARLSLGVEAAHVVVEGSILLHQHDDVVDGDMGPVRLARARGGG